MRRKLFVTCLIAIQVGCSGSDNVRKPDASPNADAVTPDAASVGPVEVTAVWDGQPFVAGKVAFVDAAGALISLKDVDGGGRATEQMAPGGSVHVLLRFPPGEGSQAVRIYSFVGVKPNDVLSTGRRYGMLRSVQAAVPRPPEGGTYNVLTSCGNTIGVVPGETARLTLDSTCTMGDVFLANRNANARSGGSAYLTAVPFPQGTVNLVAAQLQPDEAASVPLAGLSPELRNARVSGGKWDGAIEMVVPSEIGESIPTGSTTHTANLTIPTGASPSYQRLAATQQGHQTVWRVGSGAWDVAASFLPWIASAPAYDAVARKITWRELPGATPAAMVGEVYYQRVVNNLTADIYWEVIAPYLAETLQLPTLPATLVDYMPVAATDAAVDIRLLRKRDGSYDDVRNFAFRIENPLVVLGRNTGEIAVSQPPSLGVARMRQAAAATPGYRAPIAR